MPLRDPIGRVVLGEAERREGDQWAPLQEGGDRGLVAVTTRRKVLCAGGTAALAFALGTWSPPAAAARSVEEAVEELLNGEGGVESSRIRVDLPLRFDYGNTVPLALSVDEPMTDVNHVERVSVFAEGNPFPEVASLHFTPANGRANASTRIRLNQGEQEVVAVAQFNDGSAHLARKSIEVAISGCSAESGVVVGYPMPHPEPRLKVPVHARPGEIVEISTMISHWMETGLRVDVAGNPIPRRIINRMVCFRDGEPIFAADLSPAVAANAYLTFSMVARESAVLTFVWVEDGGAIYDATHSLTVT